MFILYIIYNYFILFAAGGAGGGTTFEALQKADAAWEKLRNMKARVVKLLLLT